MLSRGLDVTLSGLGLLLAAPLVGIAIAGIRLASPGPALYRAQRMGRFERPFTMYKLRTMHIRADDGAQITGPNDPRVFTFGKFLRTTKIDELPQLWNVLNGDMSLVGPRPEAVDIVRRNYTRWMKETLRVRPGLTSPGALFGYTHGDAYLDDADPEGSYLERLLTPKLAIERAYMERKNGLRDIGVMLRTAWTIAALAAGRKRFPLPPETSLAKPWHDFADSGSGV